MSSAESPWLFVPIWSTMTCNHNKISVCFNTSLLTTRRKNISITIGVTFGAKPSNSPSCNLQSNVSVRSPAIPKFRLCMKEVGTGLQAVEGQSWGGGLLTPP